MCGSMADIQSATAEIRRGKEDRRLRIEEETTSHTRTVVHECCKGDDQSQ